VKTEDDSLDANPPRTMARTLDAIRTLERLVTHTPDITGIVLRYGSFYGPGTSLSDRGEIVEMGVSMMTHVRGASNAKARRVWGWQLQYPSWREGFRRGLSEVTLSAVPGGPSHASHAAPGSPSSGYPLQSPSLPSPSRPSQPRAHPRA